MPDFVEMKQSDIKKLKEKIWEQNGKRCPVLDKYIELDKMVLDHAHKRKDEPYSETRGVIREALDFRVNAVLGKLENALVRTGLSKEDGFEIGEFLRNAAEYFESGAYRDEDGNYYVHPTEVPKRKEVGKREYNRVKKYYFELFPNRTKMITKPKYPTEKWEELVKMVDDHIEQKKRGKK